MRRVVFPPSSIGSREGWKLTAKLLAISADLAINCSFLHQSWSSTGHKLATENTLSSKDSNDSDGERIV